MTKLKFHRAGFDYAQFQDLHVEVADGIARVRINRPERMNALGPSTWWELVELGEMLNEDDAVRVVVGYGDDRAFSAGADARVGRDDNEPRPTASRAERMDVYGVSRIGLVMPEIDKPTIAEIGRAHV